MESSASEIKIKPHINVLQPQPARKSLDVSQKNNSFKVILEDFDRTFDTLIDYFAIIGFDEVQLRSLITEIQNSIENPKFLNKSDAKILKRDI